MNVAARILPIYSWLWIVVSCGLLGCSVFPGSPGKLHKISASATADTELARKKNATGLKHMHKGQMRKAEVDFQEAIAADSNFGPAHNNLGKLYLLERKHYLAAWEFDLAIQSMPNRFEPHLNLGLVYENVEQFALAEEHYGDAYELAPHVPDVIAHLARVRVRQQFFDIQTKELLEALVFHDNRQEWVTWAKELLGVRRFDGVHSSQLGIGPMDQGFVIPGEIPAPLPNSESLPLPKKYETPKNGSEPTSNEPEKNIPLQLAEPIQLSRVLGPSDPLWVLPTSGEPRLVEMSGRPTDVVPASYPVVESPNGQGSNSALPSLPNVAQPYNPTGGKRP